MSLLQTSRPRICFSTLALVAASAADLSQHPADNTRHLHANAHSLQQLPASWEVVLPQHVNREHLTTRPRTRYSHTMTLVGEEIVVHGGYFYDHWDGGRATWHVDTWAFNPQIVERTGWRLVSDGTADNAPPKRMNNVAVAPPGARTLMIFGGSDTKHRTMNDMWELDVQSGNWQEIFPANGPPPPRNCFSAVMLGNAMLVYGGFRLGDLWSYDVGTRRWTLLVGMPSEDSPRHPGIRAAHSAVAGPGGKDMYVYGGFRFEADVSDSTRFPWGKLGDLWRFNLDDNKWHAVEQAAPNGGRQFFDMALVSWPGLAATMRSNDIGEATSETAGVKATVDVGLLVMGGTLCNPNCSLVAHTDFFSLSQTSWRRVEVDKAPLARYHHGVVVAFGYLWLHGGESFEPHMYHNALDRLAWPPLFAVDPDSLEL